MTQYKRTQAQKDAASKRMKKVWKKRHAEEAKMLLTGTRIDSHVKAICTDTT